MTRLSNNEVKHVLGSVPIYLLKTIKVGFGATYEYYDSLAEVQNRYDEVCIELYRQKRYQDMVSLTEYVLDDNGINHTVLWANYTHGACGQLRNIGKYKGIRD